MTDDALDNPAMETLPPPQPVSVPGVPEKASGQDSEILRERVDKRRLFGLRPPAPSIALTAAHFTESCVGAGRFDNNCAHFLANAFVLAGYQELLRPQSFIGARCYRLPPGSSSPGCDPASKRPVRAREMDKWFDRKATRKRDLRGTPAETVEERFKSIKNTGFWAVFQRDTAPGAYWGGHVCIVDTDTWRYYGTGSDGYWYWDIQNCYQW